MAANHGGHRPPLQLKKVYTEVSIDALNFGIRVQIKLLTSPLTNQAARQSSTFNCTVVRPLNSLTPGAKARSNFPSGSTPAFHQTASCVTTASDNQALKQSLLWDYALLKPCLGFIRR